MDDILCLVRVPKVIAQTTGMRWLKSAGIAGLVVSSKDWRSWRLELHIIGVRGNARGGAPCRPDHDTDPIISVDGFAVDMVPGRGPTRAAVREGQSASEGGIIWG